ncbi:hypothetical protein DFJ73DRAFT_586834 [Zopfochytrium polystomum]|nr:hypothetical protein DFJ73DRAFT_586834 [Zopfochytrium polystomum]
MLLFFLVALKAVIRASNLFLFSSGEVAGRGRPPPDAGPSFLFEPGRASRLRFRWVGPEEDGEVGDCALLVLPRLPPPEAVALDELCEARDDAILPPVGFPAFRPMPMLASSSWREW